MGHQKGGSVYTVAFATTSLSTVDQNVFPFQAGSETRVEIEEITLGIVSSNAYSCGVSIYRGSTTPLSTADLVTPVNVGGWTGAGSAGSQATSPSSALPSTSSAVLLDARTFDDGFTYEFEGCGAELVPSQRLDVVVTAMPVTTVYGTLRFREKGKNPID
jgi:hypothetical protein